MNYDKLSRSLRYYYEKGIMQKVAGKISILTRVDRNKFYALCTVLAKKTVNCFITFHYRRRTLCLQIRMRS